MIVNYSEQLGNKLGSISKNTLAYLHGVLVTKTMFILFTNNRTFGNYGKQLSNKLGSVEKNTLAYLLREFITRTYFK
jgi:hypothetical protein